VTAKLAEAAARRRTAYNRLDAGRNALTRWERRPFRPGKCSGTPRMGASLLHSFHGRGHVRAHCSESGDAGGV
jgi:hypothetical protein